MQTHTSCCSLSTALVICSWLFCWYFWVMVSLRFCFSSSFNCSDTQTQIYAQTAHNMATQKNISGWHRAWPSNKLAAIVDSASNEIYSVRTLNALLTIHVMDSSSNNRGADLTGAKAEEVCVFLFSRPVAENTQWRSERSGGLSFYGNKPAGKPL